MNYKIISHDYQNTGGHCMVSTFEVWLEDENKTVFVNVGEEYCTVTTVNHIMCEFEIDDYDKITLATLNYTDSDVYTVANKYFDLCRYCLFEFLKKDCRYMGYDENLPYAWLLPVYQRQISAAEKLFVKDECGNRFATNGYEVVVPTEDGEREIYDTVTQHKSIQQTLAACLDRLQDIYECNHEGMDADDLGDLLTTIDDVKFYLAD